MVGALGTALAIWIAILLVGDVYLIAVHVCRARQELCREHRLLAQALSASDPPRVCVQVPARDEQASVGGMIDALCRLDWPRDRLEIQILDDASSDNTSGVARDRIAQWSGQGFEIKVHRRTHRTDYKAGLLQFGLRLTTADYLMILDVDYRPAPDLISKLMKALLAENDLAFVQPRLGFLNRQQNWLTRAQGVELDMVMGFEQAARSWGGMPLPFSGSGAIWRRAAIEEAGGWSGRSLSEDIDLSFRALALGWRSRFLSTICVDGELPASLEALAVQRSRWGIGLVQQFRFWPWELHRRLRPLPSIMFFALSQFHAWVRPLLVLSLVCAAWAAIVEANTFPLFGVFCTVLAIVTSRTVGALLAMRVTEFRLDRRAIIDVVLMWLVQLLLLPVICQALPGSLKASPVFRRTPKKH